MIRISKENELPWSKQLADLQKWERDFHTNVYEQVDTPLALPIEMYVRLDDVTEQMESPIVIDKRFF